MRFTEFSQPEPTDQKAVNTALLVQMIKQGNWRGAIISGAIGQKDAVMPYLDTDQKRVLNYAVNTYGAASFWQGLSTFASRIGVPFLALAGWSDKLNKDEKDELNKRWNPPEQATIRKIDNKQGQMGPAT